MKSRPVLHQIGALVRKDFQREWRTREITTTTVAFSVLLMVLFAFGFYRRGEAASDIFPGVLWISIAFAGTLAISRAFEVERDSNCLQALALIPGTHASLYAAKLIVNLVFMAIFECVLVPSLVVALDVDFTAHAAEYLIVIATVTVGFAAVGTLVAATLVNHHMRSAMLPLLLYPLVIPLIIGGVETTRMVFDGADPERVWRWLRILAAADLLYIAASQMLFRWVLSASD